jgi:hypothetical protein
MAGGIRGQSSMGQGWPSQVEQWPVASGADRVQSGGGRTGPSGGRQRQGLAGHVLGEAELGQGRPAASAGDVGDQSGAG